jgi:hypothetical protein
MEVADREQFVLASGEPTVTGCDLTLWAMPIATGVEDDGARKSGDCGGCCHGQNDSQNKGRAEVY